MHHHPTTWKVNPSSTTKTRLKSATRTDFSTTTTHPQNRHIDHIKSKSSFWFWWLLIRSSLHDSTRQPRCRCFGLRCSCGGAICCLWVGTKRNQTLVSVIREGVVCVLIIIWVAARCLVVASHGCYGQGTVIVLSMINTIQCSHWISYTHLVLLSCLYTMNIDRKKQL